MSAKSMFLWIILIVFFILIYQTLKSQKRGNSIPFTQFINEALPPGNDTPSKVYKIVVKGQEIQGIYNDETKFYTMGDIKEFQKDLINKGIIILYEKGVDESFWFSFISSWLPLLILILIFFSIMRQFQGGGGKSGPMTFGKSRHRILTKTQNTVTFKDIAGVDEAKEELKEIIEFLKDPKKFTKLGGRIPKGVLLMGPTGTGKTLLARGVAGEAGVPFFTISGSDFVEMFVGVGAARVRDLFEQGKKNAPCIIFIDEIDAVGRHRGAGLGGGHDEREQTLNQLLVEMDGFESNEGVIIVAATNRPDILDPALLRPGRFDRRVVVPRPDVKGREEILKVHCKNKPLGNDIQLEIIARGTPGFSGADLENVVNESALIAARKGKDHINMDDFEEAKDKVLMGKERKSIIISEREKKITAYHEAGHTLVAKMLPGADPIHKVTIIPRGLSLGQTQQLPIEDRYNVTKEYALVQISILLGGRIAEEIVLNEQTTGAGFDIEMATNIARKMVCEWGMSNLGPISFGKKDEEVFLGKELTKPQNFSEQTAIKIDREVKRIINERFDIANKIITQNRELLEKIANALLEHESLNNEELEGLIEGKELSEILGKRAEIANVDKKKINDKSTEKEPADHQIPSPLIEEPT